MSAPTLQADGLSLSFGSIRALDNVSLSVSGAQIVSVIGPNGAGKSSLLNCLSGFYKPQTGRILFEGRDITRLRAPDRAALGLARTFQGLQTYESMTVRENILTGFHHRMRTGLFDAFAYWPRAQAEEERFAEAAEEIIELLELEELRHAPVGQLAYGLRKRTDLGRALAIGPKVLIMDEPMAGMNSEEKGDLARFILDIREGRKIPVILVEHDMEVVLDLSDAIMVMDWGRTIAEGTPDAIRTDARVVDAYLGQG